MKEYPTVLVLIHKKLHIFIRKFNLRMFEFYEKIPNNEEHSSWQEKCNQFV